MSAGTIFAELDLDFSKFEKNQQKLLQSAKEASKSVEANWQNLGVKSDNIFAAMRASYENSFNMIKNSAKPAEIARAHEAMAAKMKAIDEEQFGHQTSLLDSLKSHWMAFSAAAVGAYMSIQRAYSEGRGIASGAMEIGKMAEISGLSTDAFQKFAYAAKMSDVESESLAVGMKRLAKNMEESSQGTGDAAKWFSVMGISVKDLSTGGLKPLDEMMGELTDKFSAWEDGTRKIAIATALFGRSGEALIPMLNKGKSGLTEFYNEAERLGIVLSPDIVRKGQEAEDAFKRFEAQLHAFKLSLSPVVSELTKYLGVITDIISKGKDLAFPVMPKGPAYELKGEQQKLFSMFGVDVTRGGAMKRTPELWEIFGGASILEKGKVGLPPELPKEYPITKMADDLWKSFKQGEGVIKIIQGDMVEMIPVIKNYEEWWDKINTDIDELRFKMKMVTPEGVRWGGEEPGLKPGMMTVGGTEWERTKYEELVKNLQATKNLISDFGWEDYAAGLDAASEGTRLLTQMTLQNTKSAEDLMNQNKLIEGIGQDISSIWAQDISKMLKGTVSFSGGIKNIFSDMGGYVIDMIAKMSANWLLFQNIEGAKGGISGGLFGWLGGLLGGGGGGGATSGVFNDLFNIRGYQSGGYIDRPQLAMLHGGEYVVPESKMGTKGGGDTHVYFINPIGFNEALIKNMRTVLRGVRKDIDSAGGLARG